MSFSFEFGLSVNLDDRVKSQIHEYIKKKDFLFESGGILIGQIKPIKNHITITDITFPQRKDKRLPFRFLRKPNGHQTIMNALWKESNYEKMYLGEWHTHNTPVPAPSKKDIYGWVRRARIKHNSSHILFLIIGTKEMYLWTIHNNIIYKADEVLERKESSECD